ncbi:SH3 and multiple ankyrin repeat domains protein 2, partial [Clarias magur]
RKRGRRRGSDDWMMGVYAESRARAASDHSGWFSFECFEELKESGRRLWQ